MSRKRDHITPIMINFHWIPIRYRIQFKILLLAFKALHDKDCTINLLEFDSKRLFKP